MTEKEWHPTKGMVKVKPTIGTAGEDPPSLKATSYPLEVPAAGPWKPASQCQEHNVDKLIWSRRTGNAHIGQLHRIGKWTVNGLGTFDPDMYADLELPK